MEEIWKDIEGYEGDYMVSNLGNVKSLKYGKERILKPRTSRKGYLSIGLHKGKIREQWKIHRLVATYFIPNPDNLPQVNHKDENKANNCVSNLEWCTQEYNINYGTGIRRRQLSNTNGKLSKPVCQYSKDGCFIKEWKSINDIERITGYSSGHISECCRGKQVNYAYGFIWRYKKEMD